MGPIENLKSKNKKKHIRFGFILLFLISLVSFFGFVFYPIFFYESPVTLNPNQKILSLAPQEKILDLKQQVSNPLFELGKINILHFFTEDCAICEEEHVLWEKQASELLEKGIVVHGILMGWPENTEKALKLPYQKMGLDPNWNLLENWIGTGVPQTYLIDQKGRIRYRFIGKIDPASFWREIKFLVEN